MKKPKLQPWQPTEVERHPSCFSDLLVDRPIIWIITNLVLIGMITHLVYTKDWIRLTEENRTNYFIKDSEATLDYYKSIAVEKELLEGGLKSTEYPVQSQARPEWSIWLIYSKIGQERSDITTDDSDEAELAVNEESTEPTTDDSNKTEEESTEPETDDSNKTEEESTEPKTDDSNKTEEVIDLDNGE